MTKQGSNKGIYIFWGGIAIVIAVVLLIIFLPKTSTRQSFEVFSNSVSLQQSTDKYQKTIDYYTDTFINKTSNQQLKNLQTLQNAMFLGNDFCLNGLNFISNKKDLGSLSNSQKSIYTEIEQKWTDLQSYASTNLYTSLNSETLSTYELTQLQSVYLSKYAPLVQLWAEYYATTAQLMNDNCTLCIEVNEPMLAKHLNLCNNIKEALSTVTPDQTKATTALENAQQIYANGYNRGLI